MQSGHLWTSGPAEFVANDRLGSRGGKFAVMQNDFPSMWYFEISLKRHERFRSMTLTLVEANTIVAAAVAKARRLNIIVSVAVCDTQGHLIAFNRMDRAYAEGDGFALSCRRALGLRVARSKATWIIRRSPA